METEATQQQRLQKNAGSEMPDLGGAFCLKER
jgi:hypothetical protein